MAAALATFDPVFLSRIQFGFVISFHIIFPSFTIGLAAWLATIEGVRLATGNQVYRRVFDFWLKVFAVSFGMGVVTGVVMAFQFGTNWGVLSERMGPIQGPLLGYESFTAFMLEATFFGVMLLGRMSVVAIFRQLQRLALPSRPIVARIEILELDNYFVGVGGAYVFGRVCGWRTTPDCVTWAINKCLTILQSDFGLNRTIWN